METEINFPKGSKMNHTEIRKVNKITAVVKQEQLQNFVNDNPEDIQPYEQGYQTGQSGKIVPLYWKETPEWYRGYLAGLSDQNLKRLLKAIVENHYSHQIQ